MIRTLCAAALLLATVPACAADQYIIAKVIECESSWRPHVWGDGHQSYGIAQFQWPTFREFRALANMPWLKWKNPDDQLVLMNWMFDHGYESRWTCWRLHHRRWEREEAKERLAP